MTALSDLELIELFRQGDESAFNEVVRRYQERIYWVARRFVNDHDEADDIVQEVFIKAYDALKKFRSESGLYTWLYRIAVNMSLNTVRRHKIREFLQLDDLAEREESPDKRPDELLEESEHRSLVEQAVAELPERQRAVFVLRYYEELPYEEIAAILKTSVGGLKANYFHAIRKIEEHVKRVHGS